MENIQVFEESTDAQIKVKLDRATEADLLDP